MLGEADDRPGSYFCFRLEADWTIFPPFLSFWTFLDCLDTADVTVSADVSAPGRCDPEVPPPVYSATTTVAVPSTGCGEATTLSESFCHMDKALSLLGCLCYIETIHGMEMSEKYPRFDRC